MPHPPRFSPNPTRATEVLTVRAVHLLDAAMINEITLPVRGSSGRRQIGDGGVGCCSAFCRHGATKAASRE
jgi:hypothetical protein